MQDTLNEILKHDMKILMRDLNVCLNNDRTGFEQTIRSHGLALPVNNNQERLLLFRSMSGLCVANTYFRHKMIHEKTLGSPDGHIENKIDYICICQMWRSANQNVGRCRGDNTNPQLVRSALKLTTIQRLVL